MASRKTSTVTPEEDSRLCRIRENQRRSRARKRGYLEDLEGRWKKCQELGVQANVDLQKGAHKVVEENILLRRILVELGWEPARIDRRLKELKDMAIADGNGFNISSCDNGCGETSGSGLDGVGLAMAASLDLDNPQFSQPPSEPVGVSNIQNTLGESSIMESVSASSASVDILRVNTIETPLTSVFDSVFDLSLLENFPDDELPFDIAQFLEPAFLASTDHPLEADGSLANGLT